MEGVGYNYRGERCMVREEGRKIRVAKLGEQRVVKRGHKDWLTCDRLAFRYKNIFNLANSYVRQHFFGCRQVLGISDIYRRIKDSEAYRGLPRKVSNQVIWQVIVTEEYYTSRCSFVDLETLR
jgi:hypothetical protein